jgi:hypothetical protein
MSVVPTEIPEVGATSLRLRQNPRFDPMKAGFGTEEYFVWSRFDGATTVKDLILMTGLADRSRGRDRPRPAPPRRHPRARRDRAAERSRRRRRPRARTRITCPDGARG